MEHLSGFDATFLHVESPAVPMHVGSLMLLDVPDARRTGFLDELQRYMATRMQADPMFARKLATVPFGLANPVWVSDDNVDLDYHVHSHTLPSPGGMRELERFVETAHAQLLDRARPLWELHLVDGMADGKLALYAKVHHAALEGIGVSTMMQTLLNGTPASGPPVAGTPPSRPGAIELLAASFTHSLGQALGLARHVPESLRSLASLRGKLPSAAPRTIFNASITAERSFATLQFPLKEMNFAARAFAGTVNDGLLAMAGGALRHYLKGANALPSQSLVAAVPVNLRERSDGHLHNQASLWRTELATGEADAGARMRTMVANTHAMRANIAALRPLVLSDFPGIGAPLLMGGAAMVAERARLANALPPVANVVVSNIAGPPQAPFIAGARVLATYPVSIVSHGLALNITAQSCCEMLDVGIVAASSAVPDLQRFAACLREAHADLMAAAHALGAHAGSAADPDARPREQARAKPPGAGRTQLEAEDATSNPPADRAGG